jgi:hypothetical protein
MPKNFVKLNLLLLSSLFVLLLPQRIFAAQLFFQLAANSSPDDKAAIVEVRVDPESKLLNVVEGVILFQGENLDQTSVVVETGGSILSIWPTPPKYSSEEKTIRFAGGTPGGFNQDGLLFRLRLSSPVPDNIKITLIGGNAYLNDGQGTKDPLFNKSLAINLTAKKSEDVSEFSSDKQPPTFTSLEIGRDPSVYDGQYFLSLNAADDVSGVAKYEIREGGALVDVINGAYVLKDQTRHTPVFVTVYDQAGNSRTIEMPAKFNWQKNVIILLLFVFGLIIFIAAALYARKKFFKK